MRIENRFGSLEIAKENEEIVKEFALNAARMVKWSLMNLFAHKSLGEALKFADINFEHGFNGALPVDWLNDALLCASTCESVNIDKTILLEGRMFQRTIGDYTIRLFFDDKAGENVEHRYVIDVWKAKGKGPVVTRGYKAMDDAIKEYFNVKELMHIFCEKH